MLTFLKKIGQILVVVGRVSGFLPLIQTSLPTGIQGVTATIEDKLQKAMGVIVSVEQIFTAAFGMGAQKGSDKLKAATPFIAQLIQNTDLLIGKKPKNEALFADASTRLTSALADILNSYGD